MFGFNCLQLMMFERPDFNKHLNPLFDVSAFSLVLTSETLRELETHVGQGAKQKSLCVFLGSCS